MNDLHRPTALLYRGRTRFTTKPVTAPKKEPPKPSASPRQMTKVQPTANQTKARTR